MSILSSLKLWLPVSKSAASDRLENIFSGGGSSSTYEIGSNPAGYEKAYRICMPVKRSIDLKANLVASVPLKLYKKQPDGELEEVTEHLVLDVLDDVNDQNLNRSDLWKRTIQDLSIYGTAYWLFDANQIFRLYPPNVEIIEGSSPQQFISGYNYKTQNDSAPNKRYSTDQVIRFCLPNPANEYEGQSEIENAKVEISAYMYATHYMKMFFENGGVPGGVWSPQGNLTPDQQKEFQSLINSKFKGFTKEQRHVVMTMMNFQSLAPNPKDAGVLETKNNARDSIALAFGIPPVLLGYESANYATALAQMKQLWRENLIPLLTFLEENLKWSFLPRFGGTEGMVLKFDTSMVPGLIEDLLSQMDMLFKATGVPIWTINEARKLVGKPALPEGDVLMGPLNMSPLKDSLEDDAPEQPEANPFEPNQQEEENTDPEQDDE